MSDGRFVQFTVSNVSPQTEEAELLHALGMQLSLEGVRFQQKSLRLSETGSTKEAIFSVPHREGWFLKGPMKNAKVLLGGQIVVLNFETMKQNQNLLQPSGIREEALESMESEASESSTPQCIKPQSGEKGLGKRQSVDSASPSEQSSLKLALASLSTEASCGLESNHLRFGSEVNEPSEPRLLYPKPLMDNRGVEGSIARLGSEVSEPSGLATLPSKSHMGKNEPAPICLKSHMDKNRFVEGSKLPLGSEVSEPSEPDMAPSRSFMDKHHFSQCSLSSSRSEASESSVSSSWVSRSLLEKNLTSNETFELLKELSRRRRKKGGNHSYRDEPESDNPSNAPVSDKQLVQEETFVSFWPFLFSSTPTQSLPALSESHSADHGPHSLPVAFNKGGDKGRDLLTDADQPVYCNSLGEDEAWETSEVRIEGEDGAMPQVSCFFGFRF